MNELLRAMLGLVIVTALVLYVRGWWRMRRLGSPVASIYRLTVFFVASLLVGFAFLSPLQTYSSELLFFRSLQTVILVLLAAPAFFVSCGYDVMLWGLPASWRRKLKGNIQRDAPLGHTIRRLTPVGLVWVLFLSVFVIWHEPTWVNWSMGTPWAHTLGLIVLGMLALLFWWHVVGTGPRLHQSLAPWLIAIMLVFTEIVNMLTGVSTAFSGVPFYDHYVNVHRTFGVQTFTALDDQALAGAILWVGGSFIYVSSIILVLNRLFEKHGSSTPEAYPDWDADERMIMPGLEHRIRR